MGNDVIPPLFDPRRTFYLVPFPLPFPLDDIETKESHVQKHDLEYYEDKLNNFPEIVV